MVKTSALRYTPGLAVIHSNQMEMLRDVLVAWLAENPLPPLESEVVLVQSNGMAQWLKLAMAASATDEIPGCGIAAGLSTILPQAFLWQAYRAVLGSKTIPETSPFEKQRLQWRIYRLLPILLADDPQTFAPLQHFLKNDQDQRKRHQLAYHLADLFDQYQVYRPDWLTTWLNTVDDTLGPDQQWQAALWVALHQDVAKTGHALSRSEIQQRFIAALNDAEPASFPALPQRLVVFGITSLPQPTLEALHALSRHCQILQLVQNPSSYYWADLIEDREIRKLSSPRHPRKSGTAGHPLLAAWGKQGRDFITLLEQFDAPDQYRAQFQTIDPFKPPLNDATAIQTAPLLTQIQQDIFNLTPLPEPGNERILPEDRSIRFHRAHSRQREVEVLHDRLLDAFERADKAGKPLRPRDVIVMVPDIDNYAPAIDAVFGTLDTTDPRYIPYSIGDRRTRAEAPIAAAFETLTDLPNARLTLGEVLDLLEVPAFRQRFEIQETDLDLLRHWCTDAGIRWGLDSAQRQETALVTNFEQNSWRFGLQRMLLGYAAGAGEAWQGIEPYPEIGGLDAALLGPLKRLLDTLETQITAFQQPGRPADWVQRIEALFTACFDLQNAEALGLEARVLTAMQKWLKACEEAEFEEPVSLIIARDSWLQALNDEGPSQRFLAGRVNICTLMPMRSIPFRVVCLLGMNDHDYPRTQAPLDFDLMASNGRQRPGDRSRRDDDRYLFLEALLSAREHFHVSWIGRSPRDNSPQPPSVLVSQLQAHISRGWRMDHPIVIDHPLQPFSRQYTGDAEHFTYAREWQADATDDDHTHRLPPAEVSPGHRLSIADLHRFLNNTAQHFFAERLKLRFDTDAAALPEHEPFDVTGLEAYKAQETLLAPLRGDELPTELSRAITARGEQLIRGGQLPIGNLGQLQLKALRSQALLAAERWRSVREQYRDVEPPRELSLQRSINANTLLIEDWATGIYRDENGRLARLILKAGNVNKDRLPHYPRLLHDWIQHLVLNAAGLEVSSWIIGHDGRHGLAPLSAQKSGQYLDEMLTAWLAGLDQPLPLPVRTIFAYLNKKPLTNVYEGNPNQVGELHYADSGAWRRSYPDVEALLTPQHQEQSLFSYWAERLYQPLMDHLNAELKA